MTASQLPLQGCETRPFFDLKAADLFAGLGGFSEGAALAGVQTVWAANHWPDAVHWHSVNHPQARHVCQDLSQADWSQLPHIDILLASPCCQGHSPARGKDNGNPQHDASRATANAVVDAAEFRRPDAIVVENVPHFMKWVRYPAWKAALEALGYTLSPHVLDAADHGVPQHRVRLFIVCTRSKAPMQLRLPRRPHVPIAEVIDFDSGTWSRVRDKVTATQLRVANGRRQHGERFVMPYYGSGSGLTGRSLDRPLGTITTRARWAVVDGDRMRMLSTDECRAGMGFRRSYRLPDSHPLALHLLGNAVCPQQACDVISAVRAQA